MSEQTTAATETAATTTDNGAATATEQNTEALGGGGIKALQAERDARSTAERTAADLQRQLDAATAQITTIKNEGLPEWQQKFNELQERLDGEATARKQFEDAAKTAETARLRMERATAKGLPTPLVAKLVGTTADELDAEIDEIIPLLTTETRRPAPDPLLGRGSTHTPSTAEQFSAAMNGLLS